MSAADTKMMIPRIDVRRCTSGGLCEQLCLAQAVAVHNGAAVIVRPDLCDFCEVCESFCPTSAIGRPFAMRFAPYTGQVTHQGSFETNR